MSTRLDLALHDIAQAAGDATAFGDAADRTTTETVRRLTGRVRRRRATRAAGTAAVAASAAGVVAFVAPRLTVEVAPAADPDAAPGTCRSSVTTLPSGPDDVLSVELGYLAPDGTTTVSAARAGDGLGTWQGGVADVQVAVSQVPRGTTDPSRLRLLVADGDVVVATTQRALETTPTTADEVLRTHFDYPEEMLVDTDDRTVHGIGGDDAWWSTVETDEGRTGVAQGAAFGLTDCDGSGPLSAGTYDVWATTVDAQGDARGASGPWELTVAGGERNADELPDGFPGTVRLVDGRLATAHRNGDGWAVEVVTPGDDRLTVAVRLLSPVALDRPRLAATWGTEVLVPGWSVRVVASHTPDGEPSVVYVLTPTS